MIVLKIIGWVLLGILALILLVLCVRIRIAVEYSDALRAAEKDPSKAPKRDFMLEQLVPVVRGERKARIHAHRADDIVTAVRISEEFGLDFSIEHCTEGYKILDFLREQNEAGLRADLTTLSDVMQDYRFNWDNATFCANKHLQVQEIRRSAEKNLMLYQRQVTDALSRIGRRQTDDDQRKCLAAAGGGFHYYRMSVYLYAFASFLEVTLLGNFRSDYLQSVYRKVEAHDVQYRAFYTDCYDRIAEIASGSVESKAVKRFAGAQKAVGGFIGKLPGIRRGQLDEGLQAAGERLEGLEDRRTEAILANFRIHSESGAQLFLEKLAALDRLFNEETEYVIDGENLYIRVEDV